MSVNFRANFDLYPAIPPRIESGIRIYADCAWILEKATFLKKDTVPEPNTVKQGEERIKSNLRNYLEKGDIDGFFVVLQQTILGSYNTLANIEPVYLDQIRTNPYMHFIKECVCLADEIYSALEKGYSEKYNLLGSNQTMVAIAVRKTLEQKDSTYSFGE